AVADVDKLSDDIGQHAAGLLRAFLELAPGPVHEGGRREMFLEGDRAHRARSFEMAAPICRRQFQRSGQENVRTTRSAFCKTRAFAVRFDDRPNRAIIRIGGGRSASTFCRLGSPHDLFKTARYAARDVSRTNGTTMAG